MSTKTEQPISEQVPLETIVNCPMKFRVWDEKRNEMLYFGLHDTDQGYHIEYGVSIDEMPTMQYSGVTDKNGKLIFAGDICKHYSRFLHPKEGKKELEEFETTEIGTIEYRGGAFGFVRNDRRSAMWGVLDADDEDIAFGMEEYWFEVIGNVFENPELLQKGS